MSKRLPRHPEMPLKKVHGDQVKASKGASTSFYGDSIPINQVPMILSMILQVSNMMEGHGSAWKHMG